MNNIAGATKHSYIAINSLETSGPEVIKTFMLNSAEHEILNAHKYKKNIKIFSVLKLR